MEFKDKYIFIQKIIDTYVNEHPASANVCYENNDMNRKPSDFEVPFVKSKKQIRSFQGQGSGIQRWPSWCLFLWRKGTCAWQEGQEGQEARLVLHQEPTAGGTAAPVSSVSWSPTRGSTSRTVPWGLRLQHLSLAQCAVLRYHLDCVCSFLPELWVNACILSLMSLLLLELPSVCLVSWIVFVIFQHLDSVWEYQTRQILGECIHIYMCVYTLHT